MNKTRYIHIGYPKNLSTTLQRDFFPKHPEIYHLGIGIGSNVGYIDEEISAACENYFVYARDFFFSSRKKQIKSHFNKHFEKFENDSSKKAAGISLEHIAFNFTPDNIDITQKVERLRYVFGSDVKIIVIIREQFSILRSLYRESIRMGYPEDFGAFIRYTYLMKDRNFLSDFLYHNTIELFSLAFGKENITIIPLEEVRNNDGTLLEDENNTLVFVKKMCKALEISDLDMKFDHYNDTLTDEELFDKRSLNAIQRHDLNNGVYGDATNFHRLKDYFNSHLKVTLSDEELYHDARIKNSLLAEVRARKENKVISYKANPEYLKRLSAIFLDSNKQLETLMGKSLPKKYLNQEAINGLIQTQ